MLPARTLWRVGHGQQKEERADHVNCRESARARSPPTVASGGDVGKMDDPHYLAGWSYEQAAMDNT